jgi:hypothetical protein
MYWVGYTSPMGPTGSRGLRCGSSIYPQSLGHSIICTTEIRRQTQRGLASSLQTILKTLRNTLQKTL